MEREIRKITDATLSQPCSIGNFSEISLQTTVYVEEKSILWRSGFGLVYAQVTETGRWARLKEERRIIKTRPEQLDRCGSTIRESRELVLNT